MKYKVLIIGGVGLVLLVGIVAFLFGRQRDGGGLSGTLTVWGFEDRIAWSQITDAFENQYAVDVSYIQKDAATYEQDLLNALAAGQGPDVFPIHRSWGNKHADKLAPFPVEVVDLPSFRFAFVDVATKDLVRSGAVWALPLYTDTLALFYNSGMFNSAGIPLPPQTWQEFNSVVQELTLEESGSITRAGAAIGTAPNVEHAADILQALMLQTGTRMVNSEWSRALFDQRRTVEDDSFSPGEAALSYYTGFADPKTPLYTWNRRLGSSQTAFAQGRAAMYIGYARDRSAFADADFTVGIAPLPQAGDAEEDPSYTTVSYADYWAAAVNKLSRNRAAAWEFARFATSRNALFTLLQAAELPTPRRDLVEVQARDENLAVFARQALSADSWPQPDYQRVASIFEDMIEDVVFGRASAEEAVTQGAEEVTQLLR